MRELLEKCKLFVSCASDFTREQRLDLLNEIKAELEKPEPEPDYWHVVDEDGNSIYSASFKQACHDHINDALNDSNAFRDLDAEKWMVEGLFVKPPVKQKPLIAAAPDMYDALELARDMFTANNLDKEMPRTFEKITEALAKARG